MIEEDGAVPVLARDQVSGAIVDAAVRVHRSLGPGMLESAYEAMLAYELRQRGFKVEQQKYLKLIYAQVTMARAYKVDMLVNDLVIVEIKSLERILPVHIKQVITYLKASNLTLGLLLNFGDVTLKAGGIRRIVNDYQPCE